MERISGGQRHSGRMPRSYQVTPKGPRAAASDRAKLSPSDQPVDRDFESQPAASPRTNRTSGRHCPAASGTMTVTALFVPALPPGQHGHDLIGIDLAIEIGTSRPGS